MNCIHCKKPLKNFDSLRRHTCKGAESARKAARKYLNMPKGPKPKKKHPTWMQQALHRQYGMRTELERGLTRNGV